MNNIYANARAEAQEKTLLGRERFKRMIESGSAREAIKILKEVNFGNGVVIDRAKDFEKLITGEEDKFINFIKETAPTEAIKRFFLLKNDYHNAEVFFKEKYLKKEIADAVVTSGMLETDVLKEKIFSDDYDGLSKEMSLAMKQLDKAFVAGSPDGLFISVIFANAFHSELTAAAKKDSILAKIWSDRADAENISLALRSRDYTRTQIGKIDEGTLTDDDLKILCEENFDVIRERFRYSAAETLVNAALECAESDLPLRKFEQLTDSYAVHLLKEEKYSTEGNIPYLRYCFYKIADMINVRIILVGLLHREKKTRIFNRLREAYD